MSVAVAGAVAGAVVAAVAPSELCSEDVFAAVAPGDPALAPSFSVDDGPFTLAVMSSIKDRRKNPLTGIYHQSILEVVNHRSKHARTGISEHKHTATFYS